MAVFSEKLRSLRETYRCGIAHPLEYLRRVIARGLLRHVAALPCHFGDAGEEALIVCCGGGCVGNLAADIGCELVIADEDCVNFA